MGNLSRQFVEQDSCACGESSVQASLLLTLIPFEPRSMKILYLSQYFPPEMGAPAARVSELSRLWAKAGHDVTVLTGFPHYPSGVVPQEYRAKLRHLIMREDLDGVRIERTWLATLPNSKTWERILNYTSFTVSAALRDRKSTRL